MSLRKIVIYAFSDETQATSEIGKFVLPINPESYKRSHQIQLEDSQNPGSQSNNSRHAQTPTEELSLEFVLDNTNTVEGNMLNGTEVSKQVENFLNLTYKLNGDIRKPNFLKIAWADDFVFDCQLSKADVNYTLFKPDGTPLRAKVSASFKQHKAPAIRVSDEGRISNTDQVLNLSALGDRIEKSLKLPDTAKILDVAKANDIVNFRKSLENTTQLAVPAAASSNSLFDDGIKLAKTAANEARNVAQGAANAAKDAQSVLAGAKNVLQDIQKGDFQNAVSSAKDTAKTAQNAIASAQNAANSAKNAADKAKESAKNAKNAAQNTANTARNALNQMKNLF